MDTVQNRAKSAVMVGLAVTFTMFGVLQISRALSPNASTSLAFTARCGDFPVRSLPYCEIFVFNVAETGFRVSSVQVEMDLTQNMTLRRLVPLGAPPFMLLPGDSVLVAQVVLRARRRGFAQHWLDNVAKYADGMYRGTVENAERVCFFSHLPYAPVRQPVCDTGEPVDGMDVFINGCYGNETERLAAFLAADNTQWTPPYPLPPFPQNLHIGVNGYPLIPCRGHLCDGSSRHSADC